MKKLFTSKKFRYGGAATIAMILFIAIIIFVNAITYIAVDKFPFIKIDLTSTKLFKFSDQTKDVLKNLDKDVTIYTTFSNKHEIESSYPAIITTIDEVLGRYQASSSHVKVVNVELDKNPTFAEKYKGDNLGQYSIIVDSGSYYKIIPLNSFVGEEQGQFETAESLVTNAINYVQTGKTVGVYFVTGHKESAMPAAEEVIKRKFFATKDINLLQGIPADAEILVIAAPKNDFSQAELDALEAYAQQGKAIFLFADTASVNLPNLTRYVAEWGIEITNEFAIEGKSQNKGADNYAIAQPGDEDIVAIMDSYGEKVITRLVRRLNVLFTGTKGVTISKLLLTTEEAFSKPLSEQKDTTNVYQKGENDPKGPFDIALVAKKDYSATKFARLFVGGSSFLLDQEFTQAPPGNLTLIDRMITKYANITTEVAIPPKYNSQNPLQLNQVQFIILYSLIGLALLFIIVFGFVMFFRRRYL